MKEEQKKLKRKLIIIFWINITALVFLTLAMLYIVGIDGKSVSEQDFVMERFGIIIAILVIPLALKFFHDKYKKIIREELPIFLVQVYKLFLRRMFALDMVIIANLIGFYMIGALNFLYMVIITLIAFFLCYPVESVVDPVETSIEENK